MNVGRGTGKGSTTERPEGVQAADVNAGSPASAPVRVGLIGARGISSFHGESIARRVTGATLAAVADPAPGAAERQTGRPVRPEEVEKQ